MANPYCKSVILGLKQVSNYRFEAWFGVLTRFITLGGLILLWNILLKENPSLNITSITSYLLIANAVKEMVDGQFLKLSKEIMTEVKTGTINSQILRPVHPMLFYFCRFSGGRLPNLVLDLLLIGIGMSMIAFPSLTVMLVFTISLIEAMTVAYCLNVMVGSLSFWIVDISGYRNVVNHISKILSGAMIPLNFFPGVSKYIVLALPFPILSYTPAYILQNGMSAECIFSVGITLVWLSALIPLSEYIWKKGLKNYEGIGM